MLSTARVDLRGDTMPLCFPLRAIRPYNGTQPNVASGGFPLLIADVYVNNWTDLRIARVCKQKRCVRSGRVAASFALEVAI